MVFASKILDGKPSMKAHFHFTKRTDVFDFVFEMWMFFSIAKSLIIS